jgi:predicted nucleic acid-binding Zn ribbon protein
MPQVYIHLSGESTKILLEKRGIITRRDKEKFEELRSRQCPNCSEPNKPDSKFCANCRMILSYNAYNETLDEQKKKEDKLAKMEENHKLLLQSLIDAGVLKPKKEL